MNVKERINAPTPKFFKILRNVGLTLAATSAAILAAPIALPAALITIAGYLSVAGGVVGAVSQLTVYNEPRELISVPIESLEDYDKIISDEIKSLAEYDQ